MMRGKILDEAKEIINGDRQDQNGNPEDSFVVIAEFWTSYLDARDYRNRSEPISAIEVADLMTLFKLARVALGVQRDSRRDAIGYLALGSDMERDDG